MEILRVVSDYYPYIIGGLPIHAYELSEAQARFGHDVTVYTSFANVNGTRDIERGYHLTFIKPSIKIYGNSIMPTLPFKLFRNRSKFDIIHAHSHLYFSTNVCSLIRKFGSAPVVITNHGLRSQTVPKWLNDAYIPTVGRWTCKCADRIICYTENEGSQLIDLGIDPDKIKIIHNGVNTDVFKPLPGKEITNQLLWIGRFVPGKGVEYLINAFSMLVKSNPSLSLLLIGNGPMLNTIVEKIHALHLDAKIKIKKSIENTKLPEIYGQSDLFILPSLEEGVPRSMLEAMACGLPVVCTELPQLKNIVDGCGIVVPVKDSGALADAILMIISDDRLYKKMSRNGVEKVMNRYSWNDTVINTLALYEELLS